ncbi:MAG: right-handed parallel beta-helix repeat-containing protein, partial [Nitrospirales bacterium]
GERANWQTVERCSGKGSPAKISDRSDCVSSVIPRSLLRGSSFGKSAGQAVRRTDGSLTYHHNPRGRSGFPHMYGAIFNDRRGDKLDKFWWGNSMLAFHQFSFRISRNQIGRLVFPVCCTFTLILVMVSVAQAATYYVATTGSDSAAGTEEALPFRTIQKAASLMRAGDTCLIRGGIYRETVTPANSGSDGAPIMFDAYQHERVIISGANIVSGFTLYQPNLYKAAMPWSMGKGKDQVFMGGAVQPEARFPNTASPGLEYPVPLLGSVWPPRGNFHVTDVAGTVAVLPPVGGRHTVESTLLNDQTPGLWRGGLYLGMHYAGYQFHAADITDSASGVLTVSPINPKKWYNVSRPYLRGEFGRGSISGVLAALDAPGEWVWQDGMLYLRTPQGQPPDSIIIEAKARQLAFDLTGKSYIMILNLEVVSAGLTMYKATNCTIDGVRFSYVNQFNRPSTALRSEPTAEAGIYIGGRYNTVKNSLIAYSAGAGVKITGRDHLITNNVIHDSGYAGAYSPIDIDPDPTVESPTGDRGGHVISFNTVYNSGRASISIGRDVAYHHSTGRALTPPLKFGLPTPYRKIQIVHNELYNANILVRDSGLIYTNGTDGGGTEIAYNVIHDELEPTHEGSCIYLDNNTWDYNIHHNLLWMGREGGERQAFWRGLPGGTVVSDGTGGAVGGPPAPGPGPPYQGGPRIFSNNSYQYDYHGGVPGLTNADFPDGERFAFGANLSAPTSTSVHAL